MTYLDVRTQTEFDTGHYPGAVHFDVERIMQGEYPEIQKDEELKVYCRSGNRSEYAVRALVSAGFLNVTNIGGMPSV